MEVAQEAYTAGAVVAAWQVLEWTGWVAVEGQAMMEALPYAWGEGSGPLEVEGELARVELLHWRRVVEELVHQQFHLPEGHWGVMAAHWQIRCVACSFEFLGCLPLEPFLHDCQTIHKNIISELRER